MALKLIKTFKAKVAAFQEKRKAKKQQKKGQLPLVLPEKLERKKGNIAEVLRLWKAKGAFMAMTRPWNHERYQGHLKVAIHCPGYMGPKRWLGAETIRASIVTALLFSITADEQTAARLVSSLSSCTVDIQVSTTVSVLVIADGGAAARVVITSGDQEPEAESSLSSGVESSPDDNDTAAVSEPLSGTTTANSSAHSASIDSVDVKPIDGSSKSNPDITHPRRLHPCHFAVKEHVGSGGFADVYSATHVYTGRKVALKVFDKRTSDERSVMREAAVLRRIASDRYPYIMQVLGMCHDDRQWIIVFELCEGGDLYAFLRKNGSLPTWLVRFLCAQILTSITTLHCDGIVHRDLKPENALLDSRGNIKLGDFGLAAQLVPGDVKFDYAKPVSHRLTKAVGTVPYMSPEMAEGKPYDFSVDVWGVGVILYNMVFARQLIQCTAEDSDEVIKEKIKNFSIEDDLFREYIDPQLKHLLIGLLKRDPEDRLTLRQAIRHPFFKGLDWEAVLEEQVSVPPYEALPREDEDEEDKDDDEDEFMQSFHAGHMYEEEEDPSPDFHWISPALIPEEEQSKCTSLAPSEDDELSSPSSPPTGSSTSASASSSSLPPLAPSLPAQEEPISASDSDMSLCSISEFVEIPLDDDDDDEHDQCGDGGDDGRPHLLSFTADEASLQLPPIHLPFARTYYPSDTTNPHSSSLSDSDTSSSMSLASVLSYRLTLRIDAAPRESPSPDDAFVPASSLDASPKSPLGVALSEGPTFIPLVDSVTIPPTDLTPAIVCTAAHPSDGVGIDGVLRSSDGRVLSTSNDGLMRNSVEVSSSISAVKPSVPKGRRLFGDGVPPSVIGDMAVGTGIGMFDQRGTGLYSSISQDFISSPSGRREFVDDLPPTAEDEADIGPGDPIQYGTDLTPSVSEQMISKRINHSLGFCDDRFRPSRPSCAMFAAGAPGSTGSASEQCARVPDDAPSSADGELASEVRKLLGDTRPGARTMTMPPKRSIILSTVKTWASNTLRGLVKLLALLRLQA